MIDTKRIANTPGNKYTTTLRIHKRVYQELDRLKAVYEERLNQTLTEKALTEHAKLPPTQNGRKQQKLIIPVKRVSFSDFLTECCKLGDLLLTGQELYAVANRLYTDLETARGEAIVESVRTKRAAVAPDVLLRVGRDELMT